MSYTYDTLNRLSTVVDNNLPAGQNTTTYAYDTASNLVTVTDPNQLQSTIQYDSLNRLTSLNTAPPNSTPVSSYSYTLGATGNRTGATEQTGRTLTWNYDGIYRLTSEAVGADPSGANGEVDYTLDPVGNRTSVNSSLPGVQSVTLASFNLDDWLARENYDSNGNTTYTGGRSFVYDSEDHMTSMTGNGETVTMIYDGFGNRVSKTANGVTTKYLVEDDVNPTGLPQVFEESVNGVVQRSYTYGLQRISESLSPAVTGNSTWTPSFYGYDGMGSVRQLTGLDEKVTDNYNYDAFGNLLSSPGPTPNNYLYRGEQYDTNLNLYYFRARYYNPQTGRFMSRDPEDGKTIDPQSLHKYLYAGGDPVNRIDPMGREAQAEYGEGSIGTYDELESAAGKYGRNGLENHHLIPQSLNCLFDVTSGKMLAIAILPGATSHGFYDQEWNDWWGELFGYQTGRSCSDQLVTLQEVFAQAYIIYAEEPDIMAALLAWEAGIAAQEADGDL